MAGSADPAAASGRKVLFTAQKNEGPFLLEWIAFHKAIGFTDLVIVSNDCDDGSDDLLDRLAQAGEVVHLRQSVPAGTAPQIHAQSVARDAGVFRDGDWVMWLDADEFLVPGGKGRMLAPLVARLESEGADALALNWCLMGDSGNRGLPDRFVCEAFTGAGRYRFAPHELVKTLFLWSDAVAELALHRPIWRAGASPRILTGSGRPAPDTFAHGRHRNGDPQSRITLSRGRYALGQVNHYSVRTSDLFALKRQRGRGFSVAGAPVRHTDGLFARFNRNERTDRAILVHDVETGAEIARLASLPSVAAAHGACVSHVAARLGALEGHPHS